MKKYINSFGGKLQKHGDLRDWEKIITNKAIEATLKIYLSGNSGYYLYNIFPYVINNKNDPGETHTLFVELSDNWRAPNV